MGFLQRISSTVSPARLHANWDPFDDRWYIPSAWATTLTAAGVSVTPESAMALSAMYSGVTLIASDLATLPAQVFKARDDGGKDRVRGGPATFGIGGLSYRLRWQPNGFQTATEFMLGLVAQFLLRGTAYAELVGGPATGQPEQMLPRHPDRITPEMLPSGRVRYKLQEANGTYRYVTQEEMLVIRDVSLDGGLNSISRVQYGAQAIGSALATQRAAAKFFKSGMTASTVATYTGDMEPEDEAALHASISRYAAGVENSFGLMLIPDDVKISNLAIEPEKAQMMLAQEWGVREVARLLRLPGYKLGIKDSQAYASAVQAALDYIVSCLRPIAVAFEQAFQRDLIIQQELYFVEFKLEALMRGDFESQSTYIEKFIRNRVMRPSEARLILNMNPDPELDRLSAMDFQPGKSGGQQQTAPPAGASSSRASLKATLAMHDNALRCLRKECVVVTKLAAKHANDVSGWQEGLRDFYAEHASFVAQTMRIPIGTARAYAAQHGSVFSDQGMAMIEGEAGDLWRESEAEELAALALCPSVEAV